MKERALNVVRTLRREAQQPQWRHSKGIRWAIGIVLVLLIASLFPRPSSQSVSTYPIGALWTSDDVVAPFSFPIKKDPAQIRKELQQARTDLYPVYLPDSLAAATAQTHLHERLAAIDKLIIAAGSDTNRQQGLADSLPSLKLAPNEWQALVTYDRLDSREASMQPLLTFEPALSSILSTVENGAWLLSQDSASDSLANAASISVRDRFSEETIVPRTATVTLDEATNRIHAAVEKQIQLPPGVVGELRASGGALALQHALDKVTASALVPRLTFSPELTREAASELDRRVLRTNGIVKEGDVIITRGNIVDARAKSELESLAEARFDRGGTGSHLTRILGTVGHAAVIMLLVILYLRFIRRRIYNDNAQLLLLGLILLFPAVLAYLSVGVHIPFPLEYLILIPVASMLLTILFDSRTGFYGTVVSALIVAGIRGNDYSVALAGLTAGAFAAYTVRDLRSRAQLFQSIGYIFLGYLIAIIALALEHATPMPETGFQLLAAAMNSLISPVLTFGVLFLVESIFDTMSDLRLTEFDTINHPLLRELALRAPGTYQHTMLVAQLAENAAVAIGANGLLAKVGAYFHDIGKLVEPSDFIENQTVESGNVHTTITPRESVERIRQHVLEGIALARAHHLPEKLVEFIPMHHGTRRVSFFYEVALREANGLPIDEHAYQYPGPRPASKETAIVMLADASEAVARTVVLEESEPTVERLELALDRLIRDRFEEGQLDECDLTIRDLTIVRTIFARLLLGLHHTRIVYPTPMQAERRRAKRAVEPREKQLA